MTKCVEKGASSYSNSSAKSEDEEEVDNETSKKIDEADAEITAWRFAVVRAYPVGQNSLQKHGKSSCIEPNPNLIMLAI